MTFKSNDGLVLQRSKKGLVFYSWSVNGGSICVSFEDSMLVVVWHKVFDDKPWVIPSYYCIGSLIPLLATNEDKNITKP